MTSQNTIKKRPVFPPAVFVSQVDDYCRRVRGSEHRERLDIVQRHVQHFVVVEALREDRLVGILGFDFLRILRIVLGRFLLEVAFGLAERPR